MSLKVYINSTLKHCILSALSLLLVFILFLFLKNNEKSLLSAGAQRTSAECYRVPIIMYHSLMKNKKSLGKFIISPNEFESDLKYLKDNGYTTIFMKDLIDYVYENKDLPEKPIILTFDDGYYNNYLYAFPLLKEYESRVVLSPIGIEVDKFSEENDANPNYSHASWENLKEMVDSGFVEIQNHSYNMHKVSRKRKGTKKNRRESLESYKKAFMEDVNIFQKEAQEHLNIIPTTFVFPFGAVSLCCNDILKELGFLATLGCENKINAISKDPDCLYNLCRFLRPSGISSTNFFTKKVKLT
ncbi:MAG: hypothetical protein RUMPE_00296 [Eubacteriales bacterium SKADARSKE-1]|nr:hypothetical protein [Eubacteriales bacterium SKADARSKE-1]